MTISDPLPDSSNWKELYSSSESRWKDVERMAAFFIPVLSLTFLAVMYVVVGFTLFHMEAWVPDNLNRFTFYLYVIRTILVIFAPVILIVLGLFFILKQAMVFMREFYQPAKEENLRALISRRLLGVMPMPPPLDTIFKYPSIVIRHQDKEKERPLSETHWARWLGGPANLVIYDGIAVYLERGNQFSRVVGPGLPMAFLEQNERIQEVVDLRPQTKMATIRPWTKDGVRINLKVRIECQISASPDAITGSANFRFPFDPMAVKAAVERMTVKLDSHGDLYEASWLDGAWGTITGTINAYVAGHTLDELFIAPQGNNGSAENVEQILSSKIREELERTKRNIAQNGVKVLAIQIIKVELPEEVKVIREKYWQSAKRRIAAVRNSRAEADRIRIREQAHAEAQKTMLNTITERLEQVDPRNLTEPLILSLSGILDQGLDDPIVRPLIAKESFAVLERVRKLLNEGF